VCLFTYSLSCTLFIRRQLSPDYVGVELGIGESLLIKAIGESTGRSTSIIKAELKKEGDLGLVAMVRLPRWLLSRSGIEYIPKEL
jgi:DNA ligase N terminus